MQRYVLLLAGRYKCFVPEIDFQVILGKTYCYSPNPIERYSITDRTPGLRRNADGSLDIWIQPSAPKQDERRANWLPSPRASRFLLNARLYQPRAEALDPKWVMPAVERLGP